MRTLDPRLVRRARPVRILLGVDAALGIGMALLVLLQAGLMAHVVAEAFDGASLADVTVPLAVLALAFAARGLLTWGFEAAGRRAAWDVLSELRVALVERRVRAQPAALDGVQGGEVAAAAVQGIDSLEAYFARYLPQVVLAVAVPIVVLLQVAWIDVTSALIMLLTLPLVPVFMWLIGRYTEERTRERWLALRLLSTHFLDVVRGLPTLRALNRSEQQADAIADVGEEYRRATMATLRVSFLSGAVLELAATLGVALVAVTVGVRLAGGGVAFEPALFVLILAPELYLPLRRLGAQFHASADGVAVAERVLDLLDAPAEVGTGGERTPPSPATATVRLEAVSFAYPSRPGPVLDGFELELAPGETVALVGESGAGKSTVAALLLGLAEPTAGRVTAGGVDLADCRTDAWRAQLAWVPQRPALLRDTVAANIRLADPAASDERVREAARRAGADAFVQALPDGYDTVVGDGGRPLSAGERRRLALARALLRPAPLVILDEPTADLDPVSAALVAEAIDALRRERTVLLIAHAGELVRQADRVVVLERAAAPLLAGERAMIATVRRLLALAGTPLPRVFLPALLGALAVIFGIGLMASSGYLISRAAEHPEVLALATTIVVVRFFGLARPIARYAERVSSHDLAFRVLATVRVRTYRRIEPLAPAQLRSDRQGDLLARVVGDVDALQNLHLRGLGPPLVAVAAGAVAVGAAWAILPAAALVLAIGLLVGGVAVPALAGGLGRRAARREAAVRGQLSAELVELLETAPELAVYGREEEQVERLRRSDATLVRLARRAAIADGAADGLGLVVTGLTVTGVLALAVVAHADGQLDRVLVATLGLLALASFEAVQPLATAARELERTLAAGRRVLELTDREPAIVDPPQPLPAPVAPFAVALEDVRARYAPGQAPALDGFSLRLEPGRRVALLGPSGAGKSTVANLLLRFLDPEAGRVTLAGRDVRAYRQHDVRAAVAVAGQDAHLFSTSIRDNLLLARPQATLPELEEVLRRVRLDGWLATLPDGFDTRVGERGGELSGGQRQRLVVARALLADAPVLVLDEPTAHLDAATASALMDDVMDAAGDRTVLLVTHRPEGLEHVDEVVVLEAPGSGSRS